MLGEAGMEAALTGQYWISIKKRLPEAQSGGLFFMPELPERSLV